MADPYSMYPGTVLPKEEKTVRWNLVIAMLLFTGLCAVVVPAGSAQAAWIIEVGEHPPAAPAPSELSGYIGTPYPDPSSPTGWRVEVLIANFSDESHLVGAAAYQYTDQTIDHQMLGDWQQFSLKPGQMWTATLDLPCWSQVDLFEGDHLVSLEGQRYGPRLILSESFDNTDCGCECGCVPPQPIDPAED
jgi:hypothetical protein